MSGIVITSIGADAEIAELRQREMMLVAGLRKLADMQIVEQFEIIDPLLAEIQDNAVSTESDIDQALRYQ